MSKYLDPKADLTFKKVFGEHRDQVVSFLNALLPFDSPEEEIKEVLEYLDPELMPRNPLKKYSVRASPAGVFAEYRERRIRRQSELLS